MRRLLAIALVTGAAFGTVGQGQARPVRPAAASAASEDARFTTFGNRVVDQILRLDPVTATAIGDHRYDNLITDVSARGRAEQRAFLSDARAELRRFDRSRLGRDHQVDAILLENTLDYYLFSLDKLQDWAWDPLGYNGIAGAALFPLGTRDFAPLPVRLRSATARLNALPAFLAQARASLVPGRVPKIHAETVAKQNAGLNSLIDGLVAQKGAVPAAEQARLEAAAARAKAAVAEHQKWIDTELVPNAKGDERIGAALFDEKLKLALNSPLSRQEIRQRAEQSITDLRAKMYSVAAGMLQGRAGAPPAPANPTPQQQQAVIEAALAIVQSDVPPRDQMVPFATTALRESEDFVKTHNIVTLPPVDYKVIEMPEYARGTSAAYADTPGALEKDQSGYFAVMPIPSDWTAEQTSSFLREYNKWTIHELTNHEGVPGHLLQLTHANQYKSRLRAFLQSGSMIEGWACYGQDVMADEGFLGRDPRFLLAHYKFQMRMPVNALLDQGFHVDGMTRDQAMQLMTKTAFQEEREAAGKWVRLQLSSAQLSTYFVGYLDWKDFRAAAERRPGFNLKAFHDAALSHGSPPVRFIRELTFGEPIR
jgi:uncharacterized protein (DUF885 family)